MTTLLDRLGEEIEAVQHLLRLVESEHQTLLRASGADELSDLADKKTEAVVRIGHLTQLRYLTLREQGYRSDEGGMRDWMVEFPDHAICARWEFLQSMARKVKALNQLNGQLIAKLASRNKTILGVLGIATQEVGLYGPDGRPHHLGIRR
jgi:flagellar biosynthesis/type III secretory pathway chaperone